MHVRRSCDDNANSWNCGQVSIRLGIAPSASIAIIAFFHLPSSAFLLSSSYSYVNTPPSIFPLRPSPSLYLVLAYSRSHSLQDCTGKMLPRSKMMTETDPLLPQADRPAYGIPIFLQVCHSSWPMISQKGLLTVRATVASFLSILFALNIFYAIENTQRRRQFAFEASNVSLLLQILYYWITAVGVSPLCSVNLLISTTVLDLATHVTPS